MELSSEELRHKPRSRSVQNAHIQRPRWFNGRYDVRDLREIWTPLLRRTSAIRPIVAHVDAWIRAEKAFRWPDIPCFTHPHSHTQIKASLWGSKMLHRHWISQTADPDSLPDSPNCQAGHPPSFFPRPRLRLSFPFTKLYHDLSQLSQRSSGAVQTNHIKTNRIR